ncbi:protein ALP1-like [Tachysurus ichikawai]
MARELSLISSVDSASMLLLFHTFSKQLMLCNGLLMSHRRVADIKRALDEKVERSRRGYEACRRRSRRRHVRLRALVLCTRLLHVHGHVERRVWSRERPNGEAFWSNVLANFDDEQWVDHFRMSRRTFELLLELVEVKLRRKSTRWRKALEPRRRLAIVLWWYATPSEYRTISCLFGVGLSTVCTLVRQVTSALNTVTLTHFISLPQGEILQNTLRGFAGRGYPMCAGAISVTHIPISSPRQNPAAYFNNKKWHSIILQAVVDHNMCFSDIYVGYPGRTHNARVLASSPLYKKAEEQDGYLFPREDALTVNGVEIPVHLIGDAAYPLKKWLMKGFTDEHSLTPEQRHFNSQLNSAHMVAENAMGRLKGRWRCLLKRNDVDVAFMPDIVTACCILHNVCELNTEEFLPEWTADADEVLQQPDTDIYRDTVMDSTRAIRDTMVTIV